jgi:hypothetical protein
MVMFILQHVQTHQNTILIRVHKNITTYEAMKKFGEKIISFVLFNCHYPVCVEA